MPNHHVFLWTARPQVSHPLFEALCVRLDYSSHTAAGASDAELIFSTPQAWIGRDLRELQGHQHIFVLPEHTSSLGSMTNAAYMARLFAYLMDQGQTVHVWDEAAASDQPEHNLRQLCLALNIPFAWRMLDGFTENKLETAEEPHATLLTWESTLQESMEDTYSECLEPLYWHAMLHAPAPALAPEPLMAMSA